MITKTFLVSKITEISLEITILDFFLVVQEVKTEKIAMFLPPVNMDRYLPGSTPSISCSIITNINRKIYHFYGIYLNIFT